MRALITTERDGCDLSAALLEEGEEIGLHLRAAEFGMKNLEQGDHLAGLLGIAEAVVEQGNRILGPKPAGRCRGRPFLNRSPERQGTFHRAPVVGHHEHAGQFFLNRAVIGILLGELLVGRQGIGRSAGVAEGSSR